MSRAAAQRVPRKGKRQRLAETLTRLGAIELVKPLHDRGRTAVLVLAYHRIVAVTDEDRYPLDLGLISATPTEFASQMAALRETMTPVALGTIAEALAGRATLPKRPVAVTFDDGFCDSFEHAFPILRRYAIPATIFVSTGYVESGQPFWFELAAHLMLKVTPRAIRLDEFPQGLPTADDIGARRASIATLHRTLKTYPNQRRQALIETWAAEFASVIDRNAYTRSKPISWEQMLAMSAAGIEFGSHTVSHPNLALTADAELTHELRDSKSAIEQRLGCPVRSLAYPFGTPGSYDPRVMEQVRAAGYDLAVSYRSGVNWLESIDRFDLRRVGLSPGMTPEHFRSLIQLPAWLRASLAEDHDR